MNTPIVKQNQDSDSDLIKSSQPKDHQLIFDNKSIQAIQDHATELWNTLSEKDTAITYKQFLIISWKLLVQTITLIFSLLMLLVAIIIWLWSIGFQLGQYFVELLASETLRKKAWEDILKLLLWPFKCSKNYLGWEFSFDECKTSEE